MKEMAQISPYLNFNGNTEEAFNFYKTVFETEFTAILRYKDMPADSVQCSDTEERIMHVALPISKGNVLMGSDRPEAFGPGVRGDNFFISLQTESEEETRRLFYELSEDGLVMMPLEKTFWGALFGMLIDKFGIQWMLNYDKTPL